MQQYIFKLTEKRLLIVYTVYNIKTITRMGTTKSIDNFKMSIYKRSFSLTRASSDYYGQTNNHLFNFIYF